MISTNNILLDNSDKNTFSGELPDQLSYFFQDRCFDFFISTSITACLDRIKEKSISLIITFEDNMELLSLVKRMRPEIERLVITNNQCIEDSRDALSEIASLVNITDDYKHFFKIIEDKIKRYADFPLLTYFLKLIHSDCDYI